MADMTIATDESPGAVLVPPEIQPGAAPLLKVSNLGIVFSQGHSTYTIVDGVSFVVEHGKTLGIVGESGSGKSLTCTALIGLAGQIGGTVSGSAELDGVELFSLRGREWDRVRGAKIGMIFQQPAKSLNPAMRVGHQISEVLRTHLGLGRAESWDRAVDLLDRVQIPNAATRARDYPHQFSGGQAQRIMIAMAVACSPAVLIADEPTTALDPTVQAHILDLLKQLQEETGLGMILVSHDFGVIRSCADEVLVMYAGQVVESGNTADLIHHPRHPYTAALLASEPTGSRWEPNDPLPEGIPGAPPAFTSMPTGCRFFARCPHRRDECASWSADPILLANGSGNPRVVRCLRAHELELEGHPR